MVSHAEPSPPPTILPSTPLHQQKSRRALQLVLLFLDNLRKQNGHTYVRINSSCSKYYTPRSGPCTHASPIPDSPTPTRMHIHTYTHVSISGYITEGGDSVPVLYLQLPPPFLSLPTRIVCMHLSAREGTCLSLCSPHLS